MELNITIISAQFPPLGETGAIRPAKLAKYFSKIGCSVSIFCAEPDNSYYTSLLEGLESTNINYLKLKKSRFISDRGFWFLISLFKKLRSVVATKPDVVFVSMPHFLPSLFALALKKMLNIPYIVDYRDLWYGDPYPTTSRKDKIHRMIGNIIEPTLMRNALFTNFISDNMLQDQKKLYPNTLNSCRYSVISTGYDGDDISFNTASESSVDLNLPDDYLLHIGQCSESMNVDDFCNILGNSKVKKKLDSNKTKVIFIGHLTKPMSEAAERHGLMDYFIFLPPVDHQQALKLMKAASVNIVLGSSSPQRLNRKVFECAAVGATIYYIGNLNSPTAKFLNLIGAKYVADVSDLGECINIFCGAIGDIECPNYDRGILNMHSHSQISESMVRQAEKCLNFSIRCILCNSSEIRYLYREKRSGTKIYKCTNCHLVQQDKEAYLNFLNEYQDEQYDNDSDTNKIEYRSEYWFKHDEIKARLIKDKYQVESVLDVGAGWGRLLLGFKKLGIPCVGIEFSSTATEYCKSIGLDVIATPIERYTPSIQYDLVNMTQVIEHIDKPLDAMKKVYDLLSPDGLVILETGNIGAMVSKIRGKTWPYYMEEHVAYYSKETLLRLLTMAGFSQSKVEIYAGSFLHEEISRKISEDIHTDNCNNDLYSTVRELIKKLGYSRLSTTMTVVAQK